MNDHLKNAKELATSGFFNSKQDLIIYLILSVLYERNEPVGSWSLKKYITDYGENISTASIGRYLSDLDAQGLTKTVSNKGRILTQKGREYVESIERKLMGHLMLKDVKDAVEVTDYDKLVQLYKVRKVLEVEAIKETIDTYDSDFFSKMDKLNVEYREKIKENEDFVTTSLNFHMLLAESTNNEFLKAVLKVLIYEQERIEHKFRYLETRTRAEYYVEEHEKIYNALKEKDEKKAIEYLSEHLDGIINDLISITPR